MTQPTNADAAYLGSFEAARNRTTAVLVHRGIDPGSVNVDALTHQALQNGSWDTVRQAAESGTIPTKVGQGWAGQQPAAPPGGWQQAQPSAPTGTPDAPATTQDTSAVQTLMDMLNNTGLSSLAQQVWQQWLGGTALPVITQWVRTTPEYAAVYPYLNQMRASGGLVNTEAAYNDYVRQAQQIIRANGLSPEFGARQWIASRMVAGMGLPELQQRAQEASQYAHNTPQEWRDYAAQHFGWTPGDVAGMWFDPAVAEPVLQRKMQAAAIGGTAAQTGYGDLGTDTALHLADLGVSQSQAQQGFGTLAGSRQLFSPLPGEGGAQPVGQQDQIAAAFEGNANAQQRIQSQADRRKAAFGGGGDYFAGSGGFSGVGASQSA